MGQQRAKYDRPEAQDANTLALAHVLGNGTPRAPAPGIERSQRARRHACQVSCARFAQ